MMFSFIWAWIKGFVNYREAGDLRRHHAHCDVTVMFEESLINTPHDILRQHCKLID